ncbi:prephenate dehydratase [Ectothiorhodospira sp. BSL-9]|uniref:prephenate dehydratase n=1 Tax=Ectothiorhodospira sp. BSL-9 TaxID=1442136 RepID=UPI0007B451AA|nr:prephenate dehydratase [Ectothiorhodospira sp. BSL-9]ANB03329.1 prephenate dehydratase [Ectothiorhodospira sp. BSL-9]TVQ70012.1 MAG: prephenate dehydratase [Chromatiaceae bacterium]
MSAGDETTLADIRQRIDSLDAQIMALISDRAACAQEVARIKREADEQAEFYRPEREAQVLRRIHQSNPGPLDSEEMTRLFREIMSACLALEQQLSVAFLGPEGTFTQAAALKHFGHSVKTVAMSAIDEVFREVESGSAHYGVVPIENSTEGVVTHTLDRFMQSPLSICGEVELRIHHHLLSTERDLAQVERVYSHQQSLAQCREWLDARLSHVERVAVSSNAEAARRSAREPGTAAIASEAAAELYGLGVLSANIEDSPDNTTRFLVIGPRSSGPSGHDKTTLLLSARNRPGSLFALLSPFANHDVSLTRIESRPSQCVNWEYVFFIDIVGHAADPPVAGALQELREAAELVKVLGSYPKAVL